jgi:hypothetical protein
VVSIATCDLDPFERSNIAGDYESCSRYYLSTYYDATTFVSESELAALIEPHLTSSSGSFDLSMIDPVIATGALSAGLIVSMTLITAGKAAGNLIAMIRSG